MVHFYIRCVINLFLLLFLSGIFTASAFGGDKKNSTNDLEVYKQVCGKVESPTTPQDGNIAPFFSASHPVVTSAIAGGVNADFFFKFYNDKKNESTSGKKCFDLSGASFPTFAPYSRRMESFKTWDPEHPKKPENLVKNGFFYTGDKDCARCFYCGLGLKYWEPSDDIVYQHATHNPYCKYLRMCEGDEFVDKVKQKEPQEDKILADFLQVKNEGYASEEEAITGNWQAATPLTQDQEILLAEQENQLRRERLLCYLCKRRERGCVYLPCGHMVTCSECENIEQICGFCLEPIEALVDVVLS